MMDMLAYIKEISAAGQAGNPSYDGDIVRWLVAEVERLRKIEDAALERRNPYRTGSRASDNLERIIDENPRPDDRES